MPRQAGISRYFAGGTSTEHNKRHASGQQFPGEGDTSVKESARTVFDQLAPYYPASTPLIDMPSFTPTKKLFPADSQHNVNLVWFRSDLRILDNPALSAACQQPNAVVVALFMLSPAEFRSHDLGRRRVDFLLRSLKDLSTKLQTKLGIPLLIRSADTGAAVVGIVTELAQQLQAQAVYCNQEYELDESRRDKKLREQLEAQGIACHVSQDQCIVAPGTMHKVYTVFTPFKNTWYRMVDGNRQQLLATAPQPQYANPDWLFQRYPSEPVPDSLPGFELPPEDLHIPKLWPAGERAAHSRLVEFCGSAIQQYKTARDLPALKGTSMLSPYLAVGVLTTKQCVLAAMGANHNKLGSGNTHVEGWISELIWRDFYRHILVAFPRVCMYKPFREETERLQWQYNDQHYKAWCEGKTGYPLVDAGMRQMAATGWMHNRARMVVAMFLSKHLLLDWRTGEKFFNDCLVDMDFASNNGGWQWAASTGTDAAPYFRIFNPSAQSAKHDPDGDYIRRYVPELRGLSAPAIHAPHAHLPLEELQRLGYPPPIVDHKQARERALAAFRAVLPKHQGGAGTEGQAVQGHGVGKQAAVRKGVGTKRVAGEMLGGRERQGARAAAQDVIHGGLPEVRPTDTLPFGSGQKITRARRKLAAVVGDTAPDPAAVADLAGVNGRDTENFRDSGVGGVISTGAGSRQGAGEPAGHNDTPPAGNHAELPSMDSVADVAAEQGRQLRRRRMS